MIKKENLYAETVITESPFFYDENGRLRVRVLEESAPMNPMMRKPAPSSPTMRKPDVQVPATKKGATPPAPEDDEETQTRKEYLAQKQPVIRDMRMRSPEERAFERERDKKRDEEDYQKFKQEKAAKKGAKPGEAPPTNDRPRSPSKRGEETTKYNLKDVGELLVDKGAPKKNVLSPGAEKIKAELNSNDTPSIGRPVPPKTAPVKGGAAFGPKLIPGIKPLPSLPTRGLGNMRTADMQDRNLDGTDDRDQEQTPVQRPAAPAKRAFKSFRQAQKGPGRNVNTRAGLRGAKPAAKPMRGKSASYLEEKMNLKRAEMGEVIKDFQASDAPQFQGKSKAKRRMMAIAAKLEADRG